MHKYIMIAIGGFLGAVLRFSVKLLEFPVFIGSLPINTLVINVLGCLIFGFIITVSTDILKLDEAKKLGITTGFLGAFTTFSTISKELSLKLASGSLLSALLYAVLSIALGLLAVFAGAKVGNRLILNLQTSEDRR